VAQHICIFLIYVYSSCRRVEKQNAGHVKTGADQCMRLFTVDLIDVVTMNEEDLALWK